VWIQSTRMLDCSVFDTSSHCTSAYAKRRRLSAASRRVLTSVVEKSPSNTGSETSFQLTSLSMVRCLLAIQTKPPPSSVRVPDQNSPTDAENERPSARARLGVYVAETSRKV